MELTNALNNFLGSWYFTAIMVVAVIAVGIFIRVSFRTGGKEYKYNGSSRSRMRP